MSTNIPVETVAQRKRKEKSTRARYAACGHSLEPLCAEPTRIELRLPVQYGYVLPLPSSEACIHGARVRPAKASEPCDICFYLIRRQSA